MNALSAALVSLMILAGIHRGSALKCYVCTSMNEDPGVATADNYDGKSCEDTNTLLDNKDWQKECVPPHGPTNSTVCRKLHQRVEGVLYVTRQCGTDWREDYPCVERTGTENIKLTNCECKGDGCNPASQASGYLLLTLISSLLSALLMY